MANRSMAHMMGWLLIMEYQRAQWLIFELPKQTPQPPPYYSYIMRFLAVSVAI